MSTAIRTQGRYDHRLKQIVRATGNIDVAMESGVPKSTAYGWLTGSRADVVTIDALAMHSKELTFELGSVEPGDYTFAIGMAGSTKLVLQTVLLPLLTARGKSTLTLSSGTHNPLARPYDFLSRTYLPHIERMGPKVTATLERTGFAPGVGGQLRVEIEPAAKLTGFEA